MHHHYLQLPTWHPIRTEPPPTPILCVPSSPSLQLHKVLAAGVYLSIMNWCKGDPSSTPFKKTKKQCEESLEHGPPDFPEVIDLPVPKHKVDEAATNFMGKLEMIVDDKETV